VTVTVPTLAIVLCSECGHDWGSTRDPEGVCECDCHWGGKHPSEQEVDRD
jgi:hypothetical protein